MDVATGPRITDAEQPEGALRVPVDRLGRTLRHGPEVDFAQIARQGLEREIEVCVGQAAMLADDLIDTEYVDTDTVPAADGFFYLVTAVNRLDEEGSRGVDSGGSLRRGTPCP